MTKREGAQYRVAGAHNVLGHQPGERVDVTRLPEEQLARMVARGSLEPITTSHRDHEQQEEEV